jgi:hypothetical protein
MQILIYSFVDTFFVVTSFLYHVSAMRGTTLVARLASLSSLLDEDKQGNSSTPTRCFKAAPWIHANQANRLHSLLNHHYFSDCVVVQWLSICRHLNPKSRQPIAQLHL